MRARIFSVANKRTLAIEHLRRNVATLEPVLASQVMSSSLVRDVTPVLIALDPAEVDRIERFQWSPYYAGADIHTAIAESPLDHPACHELLADTVHSMASAGGVILPHSFASTTDSYLDRVELEYITAGNRVYFLCRWQSDKLEWLASFEDYRSCWTVAGSFEVGWTVAPLPQANLDDLESLCRHAASTSCLFTAALDGEGFLLWRR